MTDLIRAIWSLLDSPIVWFALLVLSLTYAGLFLVLIHGGNRKPTPTPPPAPADFDSPRARRYHSSNQIGR